MHIENTPQKFKGVLVSEKNNIKHTFTFEYYIVYHPSIKADVYYFEIWEEGRESEPTFHVLFKIMGNGTDLKVIDLFPPCYYKGKGISVAIILKAKQLFHKRIISSSNNARTEIHEARWEDATEKVWKPMEKKGLAAYNEQNDYYYTL